MVKDDETMPSTDQRALTWLESLALRHIMAVSVIVHVVLFSLALLLSYLVRFNAGIPTGVPNWFSNEYLAWLPVFLIIKIIIFGRMRLFRGGWQYASIRDVANILLASWLFVLVMAAMLFLFYYLPAMMRPSRTVPFLTDAFEHFSKGGKGILVLDFMATVFLVSAARLGFRIYREELRPISAEGVRRVLIIGAGNAAENIIREIHRMRVERYRVAGMVDDDPRMTNMTIHGVPVLGTTSDIPMICERETIEEIIIAMPTATQKEMRRVVELCGGTKLKFQSLPGVSDLIDGRVTVSQIRPVDINDLLGREAVQLDSEAIGKFLRGRKILITGAGGSIGSEMCRQVCKYDPTQLLLLEQAENPLFDIENELKVACPGVSIVPVICDIYDRTRVLAVWEMHRPDVVIHAAAHKHVPMMERNPCEAIKNNIFGSRNVADACCRYGVKEFVMISTDKAVNPSSVMGASKRVAEIYTQGLNGRDGCVTQFKAVRFGNVLGSSGSVIPTFRKQIAAGGPITVTHPEMTRYFMTIPEASQLVLQAAATGVGGQIFLLDMGEPVKIVDLARQMITLSGLRPGVDIDIVFSGIRPGEKMYEELRNEGEDIQPTVHPKINVWRTRAADWNQVQDVMKEFETLTSSLDRDRIIRTIQTLVPEYTPLHPPQESGKSSAAATTAPVPAATTAPR